MILLNLELCTWVRVCIRVHVHACVCACMCVYLHLCMHVYVYVPMRTYYIYYVLLKVLHILSTSESITNYTKQFAPNACTWLTSPHLPHVTVVHQLTALGSDWSRWDIKHKRSHWPGLVSGGHLEFIDFCFINSSIIRGWRQWFMRPGTDYNWL